MEYATAGAQQSIKPQPELGRLKAAAERIAKNTYMVENFVDRFHGPRPEPSNSDNAKTAQDSYRNDLDSLFIAIDRLENTVAALEHIG